MPQREFKTTGDLLMRLREMKPGHSFDVRDSETGTLYTILERSDYEHILSLAGLRDTKAEPIRACEVCCSNTIFDGKLIHYNDCKRVP